MLLLRELTVFHWLYGVAAYVYEHRNLNLYHCVSFVLNLFSFVDWLWKKEKNSCLLHECSVVGVGGDGEEVMGLLENIDHVGDLLVGGPDASQLVDRRRPPAGQKESVLPC